MDDDAQILIPSYCTHGKCDLSSLVEMAKDGMEVDVIDKKSKLHKFKPLEKSTDQVLRVEFEPTVAAVYCSYLVITDGWSPPTLINSPKVKDPKMEPYRKKEVGKIISEILDFNENSPDKVSVGSLDFQVLPGTTLSSVSRDGR